MVLETPELVRLLFRTISISAPNFTIFLCADDNAVIDSHLGRIIRKPRDTAPSVLGV